jgi:hypothetical protein
MKPDFIGGGIVLKIITHKLIHRVCG